MSELTLQQVSYRYPGGSRYALDGISGTFSAGKPSSAPLAAARARS